MVKQYTIPIFVPHYGCPFDCVFCNQERITGVSTDTSSKDVRGTIEEYLSYFNREARIEVGFFGGSFTGIEGNIQESLLNVAYEYKKNDKIDDIRLSTRPDFIDEEIIERLQEYSVGTVELGVQSLDEDVLIKSGRGHNKEIVYKSVKKLKDARIDVGLQMMVGLPGDNFNKSLGTVKEFIKLEPECIRIYPTLIIKGTDLEQLYLNGKYKPLKLEEAIEYCTIYVMLFELNDINIIRVGLQPTENIQMDKDVIAGPFHPAFKQLVEGNIYKLLLDYKLSELDLKNKKIIIETNNKNISSIVGQKGVNKTYIQNKFKIKRFNIYEKDLNGKDFNIIIENVVYEVDYKKEIENYLMDKRII